MRSVRNLVQQKDQSKDKRARVILGKSVLELLLGVNCTPQAKPTFPGLSEQTYIELADFYLNAPIGKLTRLPEELLDTLVDALKPALVSVDELVTVAVTTAIRAEELKAVMGDKCLRPQNTERDCLLAAQEEKDLMGIAAKEVQDNLTRSGSTIKNLALLDRSPKELCREQFSCLLLELLMPHLRFKSDYQKSEPLKISRANIDPVSVLLVLPGFILAKARDFYEGNNACSERFKRDYYAVFQQNLSNSEFYKSFLPKIVQFVFESKQYLLNKGLIVKPTAELTFSRILLASSGAECSLFLRELNQIFLLPPVELKREEAKPEVSFDFCDAVLVQAPLSKDTVSIRALTQSSWLRKIASAPSEPLSALVGDTETMDWARVNRLI